MQFRKKPGVILAWQVPLPHEDPSEGIVELVQSQNWDGDSEGIIIPTLEGNMLASPGDWIIQGIKGEFYPCKPDIFEATYEPASKQFNHAYDFAFGVKSNDEYAEDVTPDMLIEALRHRINRIEREDKSEMLEACGLFDTTEEPIA